MPLGRYRGITVCRHTIGPHGTRCIAGSKDKDEAMQELVRTAEEHAAAAQRRLDEKLAARLTLLAGTSGDTSMDGAWLGVPLPVRSTI